MKSSKRGTSHEALLALEADDADLQRAVVQMRAWAEKLAAAERLAQERDDEAWVRAVPVKCEADEHRLLLALLGTAVFVLAVLCCVALVALRLR